MARKIVLALVGLMIFLGVGFYWSEGSRQASQRRAEAARDHCYAEKGHDAVGAQAIPPEISAECTEPFRVHARGEAGRDLVAALIGLACAALGVALLSVLLRVSAAVRRSL